MLYSNNMRFGTDVFGDPIIFDEDTIPGGESSTIPSGEEPTPSYSVYKSAFLAAKQPLDCSSVTNVDGFNITGVEPEGSRRRLLFKIDDTIYKFASNGNLVAHAGNGDYDDVIANGNSVTKLNSLTDIPAFVGKQIYPLIAIRAKEDSDAPTIKVILKTRTVNDTLSKTVFSPVYTLTGNSPKIVDVNADSECTGQGSVSIKCRLFNDNAWGAWLTLSSAANRLAEKIQFRFIYSVVNIGSDSAQVTCVSFRHTTGNGSVNGDISDIFSVINDFEVPLQTAYLIVRHKRLIDSLIEPFVAFRPKPKQRTRYSIGVADGTLQSFTLPDDHIDHSTLAVYVNGEPIDNFDYNLEVNEITLNATTGSIIAASYDYDCGVEQWLPMTRQGDQQPYDDGSYMSRFSFNDSLPDDTLSKALVRIRLNKTSGSVSHQPLGLATGYQQQAVLPHRMTSLALTKKTDFSYDESSQILTFTHAAGTDIFYSGKFVGEQHTVYSFAAGFAL